MRLPRLRFTARRLMVVVAFAGFVMGGGVWGYRMWLLARVYAFEAPRQRIFERACRAFEASMLELAEGIGEVPPRSRLKSSDQRLPIEVDRQNAALVANYRQDAAQCALLAEYYAAIARRHERAARYPWLAVEPDPKEP
jgi:hypothetical protein